MQTVLYVSQSVSAKSLVVYSGICWVMTLQVPTLWMNVLAACENRDSNNNVEENSGPLGYSVVSSGNYLTVNLWHVLTSSKS